MFLVFMGHYFTDGSDCFKKMRGVGYEQFKQFINSSDPQYTKIILDDGLKCHLKIAYWLAEKGFKVACAVPQCITEDENFLDVHKAHICISSMTEEFTVQTINRYFNYEKLKTEVETKKIYSHQDSPVFEKIFKYIVNYSSLDYTAMLDDFFIRLNKTHFSDFYLSSDDLELLHKKKVQILPHGYSHKNFYKLYKKDKKIIQAELLKSTDFVKQYNCVKEYVLPYGTPNSINDSILKSLCQLGYEKVYVALSNLDDFKIDQKDLLAPRLDIGKLI